MDEVQKKMQVYRSKSLPYDDDAILTLRSMQLYEECVKQGSLKERADLDVL